MKKYAVVLEDKEARVNKPNRRSMRAPGIPITIETPIIISMMRRP